MRSIEQRLEDNESATAMNTTFIYTLCVVVVVIILAIALSIISIKVSNKAAERFKAFFCNLHTQEEDRTQRQPLVTITTPPTNDTAAA